MRDTQNGIAKPRQTVAYLGPKGTFTYQAALQHFEAEVDYAPVANLTDIIDSVVELRTDFGVLPFENSTNGHVVTSLDLLRAANAAKLQVVGEIYLDVHQCLLSSTSLGNIKRLYSHPQAFGQCEEFLALHLTGIERINTSSTGKAAQLAAADPESAAIASSSSAAAVGVNIVQADIEDNKNNTTRFFVLAKDKRPYVTTSLHKTLIRFTVPHSQPGSLATALHSFAESSINLTSICSRPNISQAGLGGGQKWVYVFFLEFEGHIEDEEVAIVLQKITSTVTKEQIAILGSFIDVRRSSEVARLRGGSAEAPDIDGTETKGNATNGAAHTDSDDEEDDEVERPTEVIEGEQISADEDLLNDYPDDADDIACLHSRVRSIAGLRLERFRNLRTLCLRQNEITKLQGIPKNLKELDLYDNLINHMEGLEDLHHLTSLDLSFNRIKHIKNIDHMKDLTTLYLVQNKITRIEQLDGLSNLTMLELGANRIRELENLDALTNLQELWLGKNKITELKNLDKLPRLRILSIQSNRLTKISNLETLAESLQELYISHNGLTDLRGLSALRQLRVLDISNNKITHLTDIAQLSELQELWASNNLLESFDEVERECKQLTKLDTVYFEGNPMQRRNSTTYCRNIQRAVHEGIKQIDANMLR